MHSADRTLLTQLGFKDPDKRDPRHDLACRYLTRPNAAMKMFELFPDAAKGAFDWQVEATKLEYHLAKGDGKYKTTIGFIDGVVSYCGSYHDSYGDGLRNDQDLIEVLGQKASELCQMQIDFALTPEDSPTASNLRIKNVQAMWSHGMGTNNPHCNSKGEWAKDALSQLIEERWPQMVEYARSQPSKKARRLAFEVKIAPVSVGDILRQIELYKEYFAFRPLPLWVLAVAFPLTDGDKRSIEHEGIRVVKLGAKFDEFVQTQDQRPADLTEI